MTKEQAANDYAKDCIGDYSPELQQDFDDIKGHFLAGASFASPAVSGEGMKWILINEGGTNLPEDIDVCFWINVPVCEPPYVGCMADDDFRIGHYTHYAIIENSFFPGESPSTVSGEAEGVPVSEYAKVLSLLESSFKQNAQPAKGFFTEDELNDGWRRYKAINEISESIPPVQEEKGDSAKNIEFQLRVNDWMLTCFGEKISSDIKERNHRFIEEALELVQATGTTASECHQLVDYVFGRNIGEVNQEVGGVIVTLAALCNAIGLNINKAGETELSRVWDNVEKIRAKQAAKPAHSPLPESCINVQEGEPVEFAEWIAIGNYEYCISPDGKGNEIVEWNEVFDPQFHGENEPDEYTTSELYSLFKQRK